MGGLFREFTGPYIFMTVAFLLYFFYAMTSGWRAFLGWIIFLSVQLPIDSETIRPAISDIFIPFMILTWMLANTEKINSEDVAPESIATSRLLPWVLLFAALFLVVGNTLAFINIGYLPSWTLVNKDIGLVTLITVFGLSTYYINDKSRLLTAVRYFIYTGFATNLIAFVGGIARYVFGISNSMMRDSASIRLVGFNINPGSYGGWLIPIVLIQFSVLISKSPILKMPRWLQWFALIVGALNLVMTLSRSSYLGAVASMIAVMLLSKKGSLRNIIVMSLLVLLSMSYMFKHSEKDNVNEQFQNLAVDTRTAEARVDINKAAIQLFLESPLNIPFGVGIGTFLIRAGELLGSQSQIHNTFLWILVEMGCVGFFVMLTMFYRAYVDCRSTIRTEWFGQPLAIAVMASLIGTFAWFMGNEGLWHRHVWFILILADAIYRIHSQESAYLQQVAREQAPVQFLQERTFITQ